jgi:putative hydrolase of the HAD superfamily
MLNLELPSLVVFDLDDTLYEYEKPNIVASEAIAKIISSRTELSGSEVKQALQDARTRVKERLGDTASSHSRLLYISEVFRLLRVRPDPIFFTQAEELFWSRFLDEITISPGAKDLIHKFESLRIPIALVTDLTSQIQYRKLEKLGLSNSFDIIITSEDSAGDKSTGKPYKLLANMIDELPRNTWFIGDGIHDFDETLIGSGVFFKKFIASNREEEERQIMYSSLTEILEFLRCILPD